MPSHKFFNPRWRKGSLWVEGIILNWLFPAPLKKLCETWLECTQLNLNKFIILRHSLISKLKMQKTQPVLSLGPFLMKKSKIRKFKCMWRSSNPRPLSVGSSLWQPPAENSILHVTACSTGWWPIHSGSSSWYLARIYFLVILTSCFLLCTLQQQKYV